MEDIEILDINDDNRNSNNKTNKTNKSVKRRSNRKKIKKVKLFQFIFCSVSFLFILGCCIFYGSRLIKYYKIYNPKAENGEKVTLLANSITDKSEIVYEGDGLYIDSGNYIYKGNVTNNYIKYNNLLWRIVRINNDGTLEIITDEALNLLEWNSKVDEFSNSSISKYLNEYFGKQLNTRLLSVSSYCTNSVEDLSTISCEAVDTSKNVKLLEITDFLSSIVSGKTYLSVKDETMWLNNYNTETIWHTNGYNVSKSTPDNFYEVRPVVTLKSANVLYSGNGTKEEPYIIEKTEKKLVLGSFAKLGEDLWQVYEVGDSSIRLIKSTALTKQNRFDDSTNVFDVKDTNAIGYYLNKTYLDTLSYSNLLVEEKWNIGSYMDDYSSIESKTISAKVGLPSIKDIKINNTLLDYYLINGDDSNHVYVYSDILKISKPTLYRNIVPCIAINKNIEIVSGLGTQEEPFVVGGLE